MTQPPTSARDMDRLVTENVLFLQTLLRLLPGDNTDVMEPCGMTQRSDSVKQHALSSQACNMSNKSCQSAGEFILKNTNDIKGTKGDRVMA